MEYLNGEAFPLLIQKSQNITFPLETLSAKSLKYFIFLLLNMGQWDQCSLNARLIKKNSFTFFYGDLELPHGTTHKKRFHSPKTLPSNATPCALWLMESHIMPNKITSIEARWIQRNTFLDDGAAALPSPSQRMVRKYREDQKEEFNIFFTSFLVAFWKKSRNMTSHSWLHFWIFAECSAI